MRKYGGCAVVKIMVKKCRHRERELDSKGTSHTCDLRVRACVFEYSRNDCQLDECTYMIEQAYSMLDMNVVGFVHRGVSTT